MKTLATALALVGLCALVVIVHDTAVSTSVPTLTQAAPRPSTVALTRGYSRCGEVLAACGRALEQRSGSE